MSRSLNNGSRMGFSAMHRFSIVTSENLSDKGMQKNIEEWLTSLQPDSRARDFPSPDSKKGQTTRETCGPQPPNAFASYDPKERYWKTSQACLPLTGGLPTDLHWKVNTGSRFLSRFLPVKSSELPMLDEYSATWPKAGMMRDGVAYLRPKWERRIAEIGSGLWLGTPTATMSERSKEFGKGRLPSPAEAAKMYPTPSTVEDRALFNQSPSPGAAKRPTLGAMAKHGLWPTPSVMDSAGFCGKPDKGRTGPNSGRTLTGKALEAEGRGPHSKWPTPQASDGNGPGEHGQGGMDLRTKVAIEEAAYAHLNPDFVEWLMFWPRGWTKLTPSVSHDIMGYLMRLEERYGIKANAEKPLQLLREKDGAQQVRRPPRGPDGLYQEEALQPGVHGQGNDSAPSAGRLSKAQGKEAPKEVLRGMRNKKAARESSHERESQGQLPVKPSDVMRIMSYKVALEEWETAVEETITLQSVRDAFTEIGVLSKALPTFQEIWRSLSDEEKGWVSVRISSGNPWHSEWPLVPRTTDDKTDRVARLKAIGNGQVPACVAAAWELLT